MFLGGHGFNILINKYFSQEWEQIYQFSLNHYKFMSDYLYLSNNLKDIKDHMLDYIVSCKIFLK